MSPRTKSSIAGYGSQASPLPKVIHGFDVIWIWTDHAEPPSNLHYLKKHHCTDIEALVFQMKFQSRWKCKIEIHQPTTECLRLLAAEFGNHVSTSINYVEIAADFPTENREQALSWRDSFLCSARMRSQRQPVVLDEHKNTWYYGRRENEDGNKRGKVLAVYADRPSKILNARPTDDAPKCLHIEHRSTGTEVVSSLGIITLQDLIAFQHKKFWNEHIELLELPKKTELGRMLASVNDTNVDVSTTAFRKRATRWIENACIKDIFVMHNALLGRPEMVKKLPKISFRDWFKKTIL